MELKEAIKELKSFFKDKDAIYWIGKNGIKATQIVLQALEEKDQRISELEKQIDLIEERNELASTIEMLEREKEER